MKLPDSTRRALRTLVQLIAGGGLTALVDQVALDVPDSYRPYVFIASTVIVTLAQNVAEDHGWVPALWKAQASSGENPITVDPAV